MRLPEKQQQQLLMKLQNQGGYKLAYKTYKTFS